MKSNFLKTNGFGKPKVKAPTRFIFVMKRTDYDPDDITTKLNKLKDMDCHISPIIILCESDADTKAVVEIHARLGIKAL